MNKPTQKDLFNFISGRVSDLATKTGQPAFRAFPRWFAEMYFTRPEGMVATDGAGGGKIDLFFHTVAGNSVKHHIINSKFTEAYNQTAPVGFYDEVLAFYQLFADSTGRGQFLEQKVRGDLRPHYKKLFDAFDKGHAKLLFLTNCRQNPGQLARVEHLEVQTFHLENLIQHVLDDLDGAMPRTESLTLQDIGATLSPPAAETGVSTSIVFARLVDFVEYMEDDPYGLLFARNVRVSLGKTSVNVQIRETFAEHPEQFAYSSNGLTVLCEKATHDPGTRELVLVNPRVVNGSQTLHAVQAACAGGVARLPTKAKQARAMVRIVCIPPAKGSEGVGQAAETKEIINRICIRSNQQNPIKPWNLRANDEWQMEIARRFRRAGLFYERRDKEWRSRASELRGVGIEGGPSIKALMAQAAAYHWNDPKLGPSVAKGNLGDLFQGDGYDVLRQKTPAELAFQVHEVFRNVQDCLLQGNKKYRVARRHIDLVVLSIVCRALSAERVGWERPEFTKSLVDQDEDWYRWAPAWARLTTAAADVVLANYARATKGLDNAEELTLKNFVRRKDHIQKMVKAPLPVSVRKNCKALVRELLGV